MKLDGFGLFVKDMKKMVTFYREVLGFEIHWQENDNNIYLIKDGVLFLMYGINDFSKMIRSNLKTNEGLNSTFEIALSVPFFSDVDKEFERVTKLGAIPILNPEDEPWGQRTCFVADLEGNLIEIGSFTKD